MFDNDLRNVCLSTDPRLTDYDLLLENINGLKAGKDVEIPIYDFKLSCRVGYRFEMLLMLL